MESFRIVLMCVVAAVAYGIVHDQVTARVCVEYFTVGHPPIFGTNDPTLLGIGWGILATWWVGILLGVPLAIAARRLSAQAIGRFAFPPGCFTSGGLRGFRFRSRLDRVVAGGERNGDPRRSDRARTSA